MKINETQRIGAVNSYQARMDRRTEESGRKRQSDQLQISPEALEMLSTNRADQAERAKKVEGLKQQVSTGNYYVENGKLAEKLLPFFK
ncbi:flagellar biosynthesis anti-sigma factor FlgM [Cohnella terricola]|uniref:Negative regulator of flagellin synthesis n=1 Tax=Cohnella terricola TaxID=1289167 RepID=A0A559J8B8_9BACL|nr:flagellar biosynthesis anti-sigma factor FlgM [Cohnella terricola]TVX96114.1 flagellar biosynthesis anti-sigma factor FlgM [Cohnella terricola]